MILLDELVLPYELTWADEFGWTRITHKVKTTLGHTVSVTTTINRGNAGRPITLKADNAWISRTDVLALQEKLGNTDNPMMLKLHDGRTFYVVVAEGGFMAEPLMEVAEPSAAFPYRLTLALKAVQ